MGITQFDFDDRFTPAERASISLLFDRLRRDAILPLMLYCVDHHGWPLVVFSGVFDGPTAEWIGDSVTAIMEQAQPNKHQ
jgi:hypothetical protein